MMVRFEFVSFYFTLSLWKGVGFVTGDLLWSDVCTQEPSHSMPFCDVSLDIEARVSDYTNRIPTKDQILMMNHVAAGYEPLGIPPYQ